MEPGRIELSQRERERLKVLHEVEQGHLTQVEGGRRLQLSDPAERGGGWCGCGRKGIVE